MTVDDRRLLIYGANGFTGALTARRAVECGMRPVLGGRDDPWPKRVLTQRGLRQLVPDVHRRDVYLCGPEGLVSTSVKTLRRMRVPRRQIHLDPFEF